MKFQTFYSILNKRISDTLDVPNFVKNLLAMITDATEEDWGTKKDPSERVSLETYRNFAKRGINKKTAKAIVYRLTPENFIESLLTLPEETLELLAQDILPFEPTATKDNVAEILADIFVDIIKTTAGLISSDILEEQKQLQKSLDLKTKYGKFLLQECSNHCPMPNCGKILFISNHSSINYIYEVSLINKNNNVNVDNLIALCPMCFGTYQLDTRTKMTKELNKIKKSLASRMESMIQLDTIQLDQGLTKVITKLKNLKERDFFPLSMEPKEVIQKIDSSKNFHLYFQVNGYVTTYFYRIKEIMENLDKSKEIDYEDLQYQIKSAYKKLKQTKKSDFEIFTSLSERIHKVTMQEDIFCQAVVCYFIQSCEVFDAIA